jgi:DNA-binding IclR family transcriptional regulator
MAGRSSSVKAAERGPGERLLTLERGLAVLSVLASDPTGLTVGEVAGRVGVHRAAAHRLLATLEAHGMVVRDQARRYRLGLGLVRLARAVLPQLSVAALPEIRSLAAETGATAFLAAAEGEEAVAVAVVEPPNSDVHVAYRVGVRHPLDRGAPGVAILSGRPPSPDDPDPVRRARAQGYAHSSGEIEQGAVGIAVPLVAGGEPLDMCVGLVTMTASGMDLDAVSGRLRKAASAIAELVGPPARTGDGAGGAAPGAGAR